MMSANVVMMTMISQHFSAPLTIIVDVFHKKGPKGRYRRDLITVYFWGGGQRSHVDSWWLKVSYSQ